MTDLSSNLKIGILKIDLQHEKIWNMLSELFCAIEADEPDEILFGQICQISKCFKVHIRNEELLLSNFEFFDFENHKMEHDFFLKILDMYENKFLVQKKQAAIEYANFVKIWQRKHIEFEDKKYAGLLKKNGFD